MRADVAIAAILALVAHPPRTRRLGDAVRSHTPLGLSQASPFDVVDLNADGYDALLVTGPVGGLMSWYPGSAAGLGGAASVMVSR
jgi:hypothetical protein